MKSPQIISVLAALLTVLCSTNTGSAQQSFAAQFIAHNSKMTALQPSFITPLVAADPNQYTAAGTQTVSYGNNRGGGIIAGNRYEFDWLPPAYIQHNSNAADGFGDTSTVVKYRIASGNAEHGNFEVSAILGHCFATGSHKNGAATDSFGPTLAAGYAFKKRFDAISTLSGTLPTGKIVAQGRTIAWNSLVQAHATPHVWLELENNSTFYFAGTHDGKMQNFVTPGAFYVVRRKEWQATHPFLIFDGGMQIATSGFHTYNHSLISEIRILF
jgi:hypothetical protein